MENSRNMIYFHGGFINLKLKDNLEIPTHPLGVPVTFLKVARGSWAHVKTWCFR